MRRTAVAVAGVGCALGVFAVAGLSPVSASTAPAGGMRTVEYDGYSVTVPASWQVFNLASDPDQCVRYDIDAVYLGSPGANQDCPPDLIGRGQTITITPAGVSGSSSHAGGGEPSAAAQGGLVQSPPPSNVGHAISAKAGPFSHLSEYPQEHELRASVAGAGVSVTATYGTDPGPVTDYLSTLHRGRPLRAASAAGTTAAPAATQAPTATKTPATAKSTGSTSGGTPGSTLSSALKASIPASPLAGFDTCTAPSLNVMKAWKSRYSAIGVYIGGQNMACDYGNLSASWVKSAHALGWSLLPLYVGLQAPCNSFQDISPANAVAQGTQAANTATGDAANLGLGKGSPVYFDMESYKNTNSSCRSAVLSFLDAWTKEVHARGYISGVYSSASTGAADLVAAGRVNGHTMNKPDALWFALWDAGNNLTGTPYVPTSQWASDRDKQYQGNQNVKVGGYTLNIDADRVGGAVSAP